MDNFRYILAFVLIGTFLPVLFYWPLIHGGIGFWRRVGPTCTYIVVAVLWILAALGLFQTRDYLLRVNFGTNWFLTGIGVGCLGLAGWLRVLLHRSITNKLLIGLPELAPEQNPQPLVQSGLYAKSRNPRYLQQLIAQLGWVLIVNYLVPYLVWLAWLLAVNLIVYLEERKLRARYGDEYDRYCREVPRFVPRKW